MPMRKIRSGNQLSIVSLVNMAIIYRAMRQPSCSKSALLRGKAMKVERCRPRRCLGPVPCFSSLPGLVRFSTKRETASPQITRTGILPRGK